MPRWFLPLACTANLAKNLAAVRAHSFALSSTLVPVQAGVNRRPLRVQPVIEGLS